MSDFVRNSFLEDFTIPTVTNDNIKDCIGKVANSRKVKKTQRVESLPLEKKVEVVKEGVYKALGRYKGFIKVIDTDEEFRKYISKIPNESIVAFDTETNQSLDPLTCKLMGMCFYVKNTKPVYVPVSHCVLGEETLLERNVSTECARECCEELLKKNVKFIYHNAKFDIRVMKNTVGVRLPVYWDTMIASQLLDENDKAALKIQYHKKIDPTIDFYSIEELFKLVPYQWVPVDVFALYSAIDPYDTYLLYEKQLELFSEKGMERLFNLYKEIEIPVIDVCVDMEDYGICVDTDILKNLDKKYKEAVKKIREELLEMLVPYTDKIEYYQSIGKLDKPITFDSPQQLQFLLFDIMKTPSSREFGKSTSKEALKEMDTPIAKKLLEHRHYTKLISSFTEKIPSIISSKDGKLHSNFNQLGKEENNVATGRFSSSDPNQQQVPAKGSTFRSIFMASPGYTIVGGDFS